MKESHKMERAQLDKLIEEFESINWERDIAKFFINFQCKNVIKFYKIIETIEKVEISNGFTKIGKYAFSECTALTEVVIPGSVKTIGSYVFGKFTASYVFI